MTEFRTVKKPEGGPVLGVSSIGIIEKDGYYFRDCEKTEAQEYRALGITTELGPQIDIGTEPDIRTAKGFVWLLKRFGN